MTDNILFPVQDSTLSAEALGEKLQEQYSLPGRVKCCFFRKGICDTYKVIAGNQVFYLKIYRQGRRQELDVGEEVRLLNHLAEDGISVARPVIRKDGQYVNKLIAPEGERYSVLFQAVSGGLGHGGNSDRIRAFGKMVGRMHASLDSFKLPYRRIILNMEHLIDENMKSIRAFMEHRPNDFSLIERIAQDCRSLSLLNNKRAPVYGVCHGDLHGGDVSYDQHNNPTLFDFDNSGCGWRAIDIGVFLASVDWMDMSPETEERRQRQLNTFLDGYSCIRNLSGDELKAVQITPPIRHIFLMGFVLRYTTVWQGNNWANENFIDWHMNWFKYWANNRI